MDRPLEVHKSDVSTPAFRRFVCSKISSFLGLSATYKQQRSMKSRNRGIFMLIVDLPSIAAQVNMRTAVAIPHTCLTYSFMRLSSGPVRCGGTCKGMSRSRTSGPCRPIGSICPFHQHPVDQSKWNSVGERFDPLSKAGVSRPFLKPWRPWAHLIQMFDSTIVRAYVSAAGTKGRKKPGAGTTRGGFTTPIHSNLDRSGDIIAFELTGRADETHFQRHHGFIRGIHSESAIP